MSKLLIFIGEGQRFDVEVIADVIAGIDGVSHVRRGKFIGAVLECNYTFGGITTVVRISDDLETVTVEGLGQPSTDFAVKLQQALGVPPLHVIDMDYSFNLELSKFQSGKDLQLAIEQG